MSKALKTKEVAQTLGVSTRTIQRWVRHFDVPYETNAQGHFRFNDQHVKILKKIRDQMYTAAASTPDHSEKVPQQESSRIAQFDERLQRVEQAVSTKADNVVYEQVLGHRRELEELHQQLASLEEKLVYVEDELNRLNQRLKDHAEQEKPAKRFSLFSLAR